MIALSLSEQPAFIQRPSNPVTILLAAEVSSHFPDKLIMSSE
jgi:hypothetical protein